MTNMEKIVLRTLRVVLHDIILKMYRFNENCQRETKLKSKRGTVQEHKSHSKTASNNFCVSYCKTFRLDFFSSETFHESDCTKEKNCL